MRVLDIDLDFFLSDVAYYQSDGRLDPKYYKPWKEPDVRSFLEQQCGLSKNHLLPSRFIERHHEAFFFWRELIRQGKLQVPFDVIHVDAHSDLGNGDGGHRYLMTDILHRPVADRADPEHGLGKNLNEGNYLSFALGCEWLSSLTYVKNPQSRSDLMYYHFKDFSDMAGKLQLKLAIKTKLELLLLVFAAVLFHTHSELIAWHLILTV